MTQLWAYPARIIEHEPGDWVVTFADFPEALTGVDDRAEALRLADDALEETVLHYLAHGRPVPAPREPETGETLIVLDVVTAARAALATAMRVSNAALARELGRSEGAVRRLVDGTTGVKIDTVLTALQAVTAHGASQGQPALALVPAAA